MRRNAAGLLVPLLAAWSAGAALAQEPSPASFDRVRAIVADQLGLEPGAVAPDAHLEKDLGTDSLDFVELLLSLEDTFAIEISDEEAADLCTPRAMAALVDRKLAR